MEFSIRRVNGLFKKELKDMVKNANVLFMCILPIVFCFIYSKMFGRNPSQYVYKISILNLCLGMNLTLVSSLVMAMLIAEEKEKNTMRTLMLSAVSPMEFLAGKAIITFLLSLVVNMTMFFIAGMNIQYLGKYIFISTLVALSMIELGAVIGLIAQNQIATGTIGMPIMMFFLMVPMFASFNNIVGKIASLLPTYNLNILLAKVFKGEAINTGVTYNICIILVWIIISAAVFAYIYSKKGLDN